MGLIVLVWRKGFVKRAKESGAAPGRGTTRLCPGVEEADKNVCPTRDNSNSNVALVVQSDPSEYLRMTFPRGGEYIRVAARSS
jgi:hypothetical protein